LAETYTETLKGKVISLLIGKKIINDAEAQQIDEERLDELMVRTAHDFENLPEIIPQANIEKVRKILGLNLEFGEGRVDSSSRDGEIKALTQEMRIYLEKFKNEHPEVIGLVLCGSRMDSGKMPSSNSDVDVVVILKNGLAADSSTEDGRALISKLRSFSDANHTDAGFEVELDEFYSSDKFLAILDSSTDEGKLTWGWNRNAVKYIGDNVERNDELQMQVKVLQGLNSKEIQSLKSETIAKAKARVSKSLGIN